jgi:inward rectifier potassium channel
MLQRSSWFLRALSMRKVSAKARKPRNEGKSHLLTIGQREIETRGLDTGFGSDLYHRSLTVYWPVFFGIAAAIFVTLNAVFAFFYWLGDRPIANVSGDLPLSLFYFSIETLATVGYGDMHPQTDYGHLVATVEIFTGMCLLAVMTGLVFARFSQPKARFVFARHPVVSTLNGRPTLMIRIANARHNTISQATARLWLFRLEHTKEREQLRRHYELELFRHEHPMFSLSWTLMHIIDETSPFRDMTPDKLLRSRARWCSMSVASTTIRRSGSTPDRSIQDTTSAGSTTIATSQACRSGAACCPTTPNSTRSTRRSCEPARPVGERSPRCVPQSRPSSAWRRGCGPRAGQTASQTEAEMNSVVGRSAWPHVLGSNVTSGEEMV